MQSVELITIPFRGNKLLMIQSYQKLNRSDFVNQGSVIVNQFQLSYTVIFYMFSIINCQFYEVNIRRRKN